MTVQSIQSKIYMYTYMQTQYNTNDQCKIKLNIKNIKYRQN